ncbi:MAG: T9SS type A sorting domain-containing protein [Bacteroidota bacterium]
MSLVKKIFLVIFFFINLIPAKGSIGLYQSDEVTQAQVVFEFSEVMVVEGDSRELAVAFHSITFIDSIGHPIGEIIFGTAEANDLQDEGWFKNEVSTDGEAFQWAGGTSKQAKIQLTVPAGTEGLILKIISVKDSLWMNVRIDEEPATTLRADANWHQGYVPVGENVPEPKPDTEPEWIEGRYFPHFPETDRIYAFQLPNTFSEDGSTISSPAWRIRNSYDDMMALTIVSMQGLVNRNKPRIYLDWKDKFGNQQFWQNILNEHIEIVPFEMDGLSIMNFIFRHYADRFAGAVIYDPDVPETINLATMIAGLENRVILAPQQLGLPGIPEFESYYDLRELEEEQGWVASIESQTKIYNWVYDNLWPNLEHRIIGHLSPGPPTSRQASDLNNYFPLEMASRDYMIALKLPAIYLDPQENPQAALLGQFLEDAPSPVPVTGVFAGMEVGTTGFVSEYGDWQACISWPGEIVTCGNLTVFSGVRPDIITYKAPDAGKIFSTLGDNPVATMFCTDGDALYYLMSRGFYNFFGWDHVNHQKFGWTINPTLAEIAPVIMNYYISSRDNASFLTGLSGAGYAYPQLMDDAELNNYLEHTARYLQDCGLHTVRIDERKGAMTKKLAHQYYENLHDAGYLGNIFGYGGSNRGFGFDYYGVPTPTIRPAYTIRSHNESEIVDDILSRNPDEDFFNFTQPQFPQTYLVQDDSAYAKDAIFVPKDRTNCCLVTIAGPITLVAGDYSVNFRLKVPQNQSTENFIQIYVGEKPADWRFIERLNLAPADFKNPNEYQDFTLFFTLDSLTTEIEFRIDFFNGISDLYVDYIKNIHNDEPILPVFASILIGLCIDPSEFQYQTEAPGRFTSIFEDSGGIVLSPDEFAAALNPEYMIELATPILGDGHAAIIQARQQLDAGEFLNSLSIVRNALRQINGAKIALDVTSIDFDTVEIGDMLSKELIINNFGTADLDVSDVTNGNPGFKVNPTTFSVSPLNSQTITVQFVPGMNRIYTDTLVIHCNAINDTAVRVPISASGVFSQEPKIISIEDVPNDQGGQVKITFYPSSYDGSDSQYQITTYSVEKLLENDGWETIKSIEAGKDSMYTIIASTSGDSTSNGILWTTFHISAHTDNAAIFFVSNPDSGYSVDNIAPGTPQDFAAWPMDSEILLTWNYNSENDLQQYAIYRSLEENFEPSEMATYTYATADTFYSDEQVSLNTMYYYALSAFDHAGNESDISTIVSAIIQDVGVINDQHIPWQFRLYQNFPNPFHTMTRISFDLPTSSEVKVYIYNMEGTLVNEMSQKYYEAGHYELILNTSGFSPGFYFYKIEAGNFTDGGKLILIK